MRRLGGIAAGALAACVQTTSSGTGTTTTSGGGTSSGSGCAASCPTGLACHGNQCEPIACGPDAGCPTSLTCIDGYCGSEGCTPSCGANYVCLSDVCIPETPTAADAGCPKNYTLCAGSANAYCANLASDAQNCGSCAVGCDAGGVCVDGGCALGCTVGDEVFAPGAISDGGTYACCNPSISTTAFTPGFQSPSVYGLTALNPTSGDQLLWVGDFDGQNGPDIVAADGEVAVLLNQGTGELVAKRYDAGLSAAEIVAGDVDGDGLADLVVGSLQAGLVPNLMLATSPGVPGPAAPIAQAFAGAEPQSLVQALDVIPDLIAGVSLPGVIVASYAYSDGGPCGNGTGVLNVLQWQDAGLGLVQSQPECTWGINEVRHADLNGDGYPDLLVAAIGNITIFLNSGQADQPLNPPVDLNLDFTSVTVGAFTGRSYADGGPMLDLAVAGQASDGTVTVTLYPNDTVGSGTFSPGSSVTYKAPLYLYAIATADFNGDGFPDLVVSTQGNPGATQLLFGDGHGKFSVGPAATIGVGDAISDLYTADFADNGHPSTASSFVGSGSVNVYLNNCP